VEPRLKEVTENSDASSKNLIWSRNWKKIIMKPSKRRRKISKSVEQVRRDRRPTDSTSILDTRIHLDTIWIKFDRSSFTVTW